MEEIVGGGSVEVEEGRSVRVKCLEPEHYAMSLARARIQTTQSGHERINHEGTTPSG